MNEQLLEKLRIITDEEQAILDGQTSVRKDLYTSHEEFIIDSKKLLEKGKLIEIRPHTRFVHFPKHRHNYVEIVYMCCGTTTQIINQTDRITLQEGDLLFLNQNVYQEILPASENDIAVNFIILPEFFYKPVTMIEKENVLRDFLIAALSQESSKISYLHFHTKDIIPVQNLIENMIWTIMNKIPNSNVVVQTSMGLLFLNLSLFADTLNHEGPNQYYQNIVLTVLNYIETHYKSGTLTEISSQLKLPDYTVSRLLKEYTGTNFKELLQTRRLQQASYLLLHTSLSVEQIIAAVGYNNTSYFYRKFKENYGYSPKEYRVLK